MVRRLGALVLLAATMCGAGLAQEVTLDRTPLSRAQVLALMSSMGVQQNIDASLTAMQGKIKAAARASFLKRNPSADAATLKKLDAVFDTTPLFSFDAISEPLIAVYQKNLGAADVQAAIDFYTSDAGKRMLAKLAVIQRETNEGGGKLVQQKLAAYSEELERKLTAFRSELEKQKPLSEDGSKASDDKRKTPDERSR
jgi:hypothetical protein